jgi:hypothetical protein
MARDIDTKMIMLIHPRVIFFQETFELGLVRILNLSRRKLVGRSCFVVVKMPATQSTT